MNQTPTDPIDYAKAVLAKDLQTLAIRLTDEDTAAATFFISILYQLNACMDETDLAQLFVELSTAAFHGFQMQGESIALVDRVLANAETIAHTMSADGSHPH